MKHLVVCLICWTACSISAVPAHAQNRSDSRWEGEIKYLGGTWPLRVNMADIEQGKVILSFPALGVSGLSANASLHDDGTTVISLPYGLGEQSLHMAERLLSTPGSDFSEDTIVIQLNPDPFPQPDQFELSFQSGTETLKGTLYVPSHASESSQPPIIVVGHGADRFTREMPEYLFWSEFLTRQGYAVFLYDKRGLGQSQGQYEGASLVQYSEDLVAAANAASAHTAIDPDKLVLLGGSQFG